ncbi:DUF4738 domain-containing protein [bacterium SCSIO 12643]|nr:DUF4738 domain-containing protein [bacterium SCSIO 12643]
MKNVVFILLVIFSFSCSENDSKVKETKKETIVRFFPEEINMNTKFTGVNDSIQLIVKMKSSDKDFVTFSRVSRDTVWEDRYRDNSVELSLSLNQTKFFAKTFTKHDLLETMPKEFMDQSLIFDVWYESFDPKVEEVKLQMTVCKPETDYCYFYSIYISVSGTFKIELEEIS